MRAPTPLKLAPDHDPATCPECAQAHRDMQRWLARLDRTCRCCGTRIAEEQIVFIVKHPDSAPDSQAKRDEWRMCGSCWHAGYQVGETVDAA